MNSIKIIKLSILLSILFTSLNCNLSKKNTNIFLTTDGKIITFETVKIQNKGWGYIIYTNGETFIYQTFIPAIHGTFYFDTPQKAKITAAYVVKKLILFNDLPYVQVKELDSLGVLTPQILDFQKFNY